MSTLSLRLPNSLHEQLRKLAEAEGVSINQLIATAAAEKVSSLMTVKYLEDRAARGDRRKFEQILTKVPDVAPQKGDEWGDEVAEP